MPTGLACHRGPASAGAVRGRAMRRSSGINCLNRLRLSLVVMPLAEILRLGVPAGDGSAKTLHIAGLSSDSRMYFYPRYSRKSRWVHRLLGGSATSGKEGSRGLVASTPSRVLSRRSPVPPDCQGAYPVGSTREM